MDNNNFKYNPMDLPKFIGKLKKMDKRTTIFVNILKIAYIIIIVVFILGIIALVINEELLSRTVISPVITLIGLILVFIYLHYRGKDYKDVDYSQTTYKMLQETSERYKPFLKKDIWVFPGTILVAIGRGLSPSPYRNFWDFQLFFWSLILIGGVIGVVYWYFRWKPIKDNADKLIKEIEG